VNKAHIETSVFGEVLLRMVTMEEAFIHERGPLFVNGNLVRPLGFT